MGSKFCSCTGKKQPDENNVEQKRPISELDKTQLSNVSQSESIENIHSSQDILDDDFKSQITKPIDEYIASVPTAYQTEHDRIVDEMKSCAPERYLGLLFSDYPHVNGPTVKEMARRVVTSNAVKQRLIDQIDERIEPTFQSRTADWNSLSRETTRPAIKTYIEKLVNEAFEHVKFP